MAFSSSKHLRKDSGEGAGASGAATEKAFGGVSFGGGKDAWGAARKASDKNPELSRRCVHVCVRVCVCVCVRVYMYAFLFGHVV